MNEPIYKYPRTRHIEGSALQYGDEDLPTVGFEGIANQHLVIEEKMDGANAAISFARSGDLLLQSRGHFLTGGHRERHFGVFKKWARVHEAAFRATLSDRYVLYGEWLWAKHTIFYDALPHYFMEFDILDKGTGEFLSTPARQTLLKGLPIVSVRVLHQGPIGSTKELTALHGPSPFRTPEALKHLAGVAEAKGLPVDRILKETDPSSDMEGLYIKCEDENQVLGRYKHVRGSFLATASASDSHWNSRPIIPNHLAPEVNLFS